MDYGTIWEHVDRDIQDYQLVVHRDDGLFRNLEYGNPRWGEYQRVWLDTSPWCLTYRIPGFSLVWRLPSSGPKAVPADPFDYFGQTLPDGTPDVNTWVRWLDIPGRRDTVTMYDSLRLRQLIDEVVDAAIAQDQQGRLARLRQAVSTHLQLTGSEELDHHLIRQFRYQGGRASMTGSMRMWPGDFNFAQVDERWPECRRFDPRYVWACGVIVRIIREYRQAQAG